jgi:cytochrome oxidase Cu insertion factor (SCO1/SenC/PrrC family)
MSFKDSRLWLLAIPLAIIGSAFLASQLRAPPGPLDVTSKVDLSFTGLRTLSGQPGDEIVTPRDFSIIAFGYTSCPDVCPATLMAVHEILEQLGEDADRMRPVFITLDPERDTPEKLGRYTTAFDGRIIALTGPGTAIERAAKNFHIRYIKRPVEPNSPEYQIDHTAVLYLISPERQVIATIPETGAPRDIAAAMVAKVRPQLRR